MLFEQKQDQSAISPKTCFTEKAGTYSNAEITNFWNRS